MIDKPASSSFPWMARASAPVARAEHLEGSSLQGFREFRRPRLSQNSIADAGDNRFRNAVLY